MLGDQFSWGSRLLRVERVKSKVDGLGSKWTVLKFKSGQSRRRKLQTSQVFLNESGRSLWMKVMVQRIKRDKGLRLGIKVGD